MPLIRRKLSQAARGEKAYYSAKEQQWEWLRAGVTEWVLQMFVIFILMLNNYKYFVLK